MGASDREPESVPCHSETHALVSPAAIVNCATGRKVLAIIGDLELAVRRPGVRACRRPGADCGSDRLRVKSGPAGPVLAASRVSLVRQYVSGSPSTAWIAGQFSSSQ